MTSSLISLQEQLCNRFGSAYLPLQPNGIVGISESALLRFVPLNGLRHPPEAETSGWFLWGGDYQESDDFFQPMHWEHLVDRLPEVLPYLGLSPGWRFLLAPDYEDVWFDADLLMPS